MTSFDNREKGFEKKFVTDEELKFKVSSRRNRYLGEWAAGILQLKDEKQSEYVQSVVKADLEEAGDDVRLCHRPSCSRRQIRGRGRSRRQVGAQCTTPVQFGGARSDGCGHRHGYTSTEPRGRYGDTGI